MSIAGGRRARLAARLGAPDADLVLEELPASLLPTIDALLDAGDALPLAEHPPASLRPRLRAIFSDHLDVRLTRSDRHRAGRAREPIFDSRHAKGLAGIRGSASETVTSVFALGSVDVVVDADRVAQRHRIGVLVLGSLSKQVILELRDRNAVLVERVAAAPKATFAPVSAGEYQLCAEIDNERYELALDLRTD